MRIKLITAIATALLSAPLMAQVVTSPPRLNQAPTTAGADATLNQGAGVAGVDDDSISFDYGADSNKHESDDTGDKNPSSGGLSSIAATCSVVNSVSTTNAQSVLTPSADAVTCRQDGGFVRAGAGGGYSSYVNWKARFSISSSTYNLADSSWNITWSGDCTGSGPDCTSAEHQINGNVIRTTDTRTLDAKVTIHNKSTNQTRVIDMQAVNMACGFTTMSCL